MQELAEALQELTGELGKRVQYREVPLGADRHPTFSLSFIPPGHVASLLAAGSSCQERRSGCGNRPANGFLPFHHGAGAGRPCRQPVSDSHSITGCCTTGSSPDNDALLCANGRKSSRKPDMVDIRSTALCESADAGDHMMDQIGLHRYACRLRRRQADTERQIP